MHEKGDFIHFDEIEDVLSSTDLLADVIPKLSDAPEYWKWAIVASHSGLQGAMVCAFQDTSGASVLHKKSARALLRWFDEGGEFPERKWLAGFEALLIRCVEGGIFTLTEQQENDVRRLHNEFRNTFSHFTPQSWYIRPLGLPRMIESAIYLIESAMKHSNAAYRMDETQKRRLADNLAKARAALR